MKILIVFLIALVGVSMAVKVDNLYAKNDWEILRYVDVDNTTSNESNSSESSVSSESESESSSGGSGSIPSSEESSVSESSSDPFSAASKVIPTFFAISLIALLF